MSNATIDAARKRIIDTLCSLTIDRRELVTVATIDMRLIGRRTVRTTITATDGSVFIVEFDALQALVDSGYLENADAGRAH